MKNLSKLDKKMVKHFWKVPFSPKQIFIGLVPSRQLKERIRRALSINRPRKGKMHGEE